MRENLWKYGPIFMLILLSCLFVFQSIGFPTHDFGNYYFGAQVFVDGNLDSSIYFPYEFNTAIVEKGQNPGFLSYAPNTPFLAILFAPITFLSPTNAKLVFNIFSVLIFLFSFIRITTFYKIKPFQSLLIIVLIAYPLRNEILFGQAYLILLVLLIEFLLAYENKKLGLAAIFLSFAIFLKIFPILILFMILFRKDFKLLIYTAMWSFVLLSISVFFIGVDIWWFFASEVFTKASKGEISTAFVDNYQSFFMFIKRIFVYDKIENPNSLFNNYSLFFAINISLKIGLLILGYFVTKRSNSLTKVFSFWILISIILSPYGSTYTFVLFIFPMVVIFNSIHNFLLKWSLFILMLIICNVPPSFYLQLNFPWSYVRFLCFLIFGLVLLIHYRKSINWKIPLISAFVVLLATLSVHESNEELSMPVISWDSPILVHDFSFGDNQLNYSFWTEKGTKEKKMPLNFTKVEELNIQNNQVFVKGQQLTFNKSNKRKPILINDHYLFYLSDLNRGLGFYQLRMIELKM